MQLFDHPLEPLIWLAWHCTGARLPRWSHRSSVNARRTLSRGAGLSSVGNTTRRVPASPLGFSDYVEFRPRRLNRCHHGQQGSHCVAHYIAQTHLDWRRRTSMRTMTSRRANCLQVLVAPNAVTRARPLPSAMAHRSTTCFRLRTSCCDRRQPFGQVRM